MKGDFMLQEKKNEKDEIIKIISEIDEILGTRTNVRKKVNSYDIKCSLLGMMAGVMIPITYNNINPNLSAENKETLIAEGKRLWNKEEAEYARSIGVEYKGVDYRVYLNAEAVYEIPIINCRLSKDSYRFYIPYARRHTTGKSEEELIALCNNDKEKICELNTDLKMKLKLCLKVDDLLYLNFIRNDAQQSAHTPKDNRKS